MQSLTPLLYGSIQNTTKFEEATTNVSQSVDDNFLDTLADRLRYVAYDNFSDYASNGMTTPYRHESIYSTSNIKQATKYMPQSVVDSFFINHAADPPPYVQQDMFSEHASNGMTFAEYHFETHMDQFYRVISFFRELQAHNVSTDEEDTFIGPLPNYVIRAEFKSFIYDDRSYRKTLIDSRKYLEMKQRKSQAEIGLLLSRPKILGDSR